MLRDMVHWSIHETSLFVHILIKFACKLLRLVYVIYRNLRWFIAKDKKKKIPGPFSGKWAAQVQKSHFL